MPLFVGTSGWAYKEWKPGFYPADVPQARFLEHYGTVFNACEANATFYRTQPLTTLEKWNAQTPDELRFAVKVHRGLSYMKRITPDEDRLVFLKDFLTSLHPLGDKVGALLFQVHPRRKADEDDLKGLVRALPPDCPPVAFDLNDPSWHTGSLQEDLGASGHTVCVSDTEGKVPGALPPGPIAYVRLRAGRYSDDAREAWADLLQRESAERDVYVFSKHEGVEATDPFGGVGLARWLRERSG